jgi:hypothetical protein
MEPISSSGEPNRIRVAGERHLVCRLELRIDKPILLTRPLTIVVCPNVRSPLFDHRTPTLRILALIGVKRL